MGDVVHSMPAVAALRERHPEWESEWAIEPQWSELLAASSGNGARIARRGVAEMPLVDKWYRVPTKEWKGRAFSGETFRRDWGATQGVAGAAVRSLRGYAVGDTVGGGGKDGRGEAVCGSGEASGRAGEVVL